MVTKNDTKRNDQMTLSECAAYDHKTGAKTRLTGWGIVCKDRQQRKVSRKARREARNSNQQQQEGN